MIKPYGLTPTRYKELPIPIGDLSHNIQTVVNLSSNMQTSVIKAV